MDARDGGTVQDYGLGQHQDMVMLDAAMGDKGWSLRDDGKGTTTDTSSVQGWFHPKCGEPPHFVRGLQSKQMRRSSLCYKIHPD